MSELTVGTFMALLCLARDGPVYSEGGSGWPSIWDYGMLVSLLSGVCELLEKMGVMAVLHDPGFDMSLGYMAYCRSRDVDLMRCTLLWLPYDINMGKMSDVLCCSASSTRCHNADGERIEDRIVTTFPVNFIRGDLTPLPDYFSAGASVVVSVPRI